MRIFGFPERKRGFSLCVYVVFFGFCLFFWRRETRERGGWVGVREEVVSVVVLYVGTDDFGSLQT